MAHMVKLAAGLLFVAAAFSFAINALVCLSEAANVTTVEEMTAMGAQHDVIVVLGASVRPGGDPSDALRERLDSAIEIYRAGAAPKIIMSGDNFSDAEHYDEVSAMKQYVVDRGVPSEDVFCDHAGICTYDSMYRAKFVFGATSPIIVTQGYHLYRALYDADGLGMDAVGIASDSGEHGVDLSVRAREVLARVGDFFKVWTRASASYLSEPVSLDQSGDVTTW